MIKKALKQIRDQYIVDQVQRIRLPEFEAGAICRYRITFSGRVQKVGFRLEVQELAKRLDLTGFCENLPSGEVLAELQGQENQIRFLITFMESLIRIKITGKVMTEIPVNEAENSFRSDLEKSDGETE